MKLDTKAVRVLLAATAISATGSCAENPGKPRSAPLEPTSEVSSSTPVPTPASARPPSSARVDVVPVASSDSLDARYAAIDEARQNGLIPPNVPSGGLPVATGPSVRQMAVSVGPGLPVDGVLRVVRQEFGKLRACYEAAIRAQPNASGSITMKLTIGPSGRTMTSSVDATSFSDGRMNDCVGRVFASLSFPRPDPPGTVPVTYAVSFRAP